MTIKIYLADLVHDYVPGNYVVPLNIGLVSAYAKARFKESVRISLFKSPQKLLDAIRSSPPPMYWVSPTIRGIKN